MCQVKQSEQDRFRTWKRAQGVLHLIAGPEHRVDIPRPVGRVWARRTPISRGPQFTLPRFRPRHRRRTSATSPHPRPRARPDPRRSRPRTPTLVLDAQRKLATRNAVYPQASPAVGWGCAGAAARRLGPRHALPTRPAAVPSSYGSLSRMKPFMRTPSGQSPRARRLQSTTPTSRHSRQFNPFEAAAARHDAELGTPVGKPKKDCVSSIIWLTRQSYSSL